MLDEQMKKFIASFKAAANGKRPQPVKATLLAKTYWNAYHRASQGEGVPKECVRFKLLNVVEVR